MKYTNLGRSGLVVSRLCLGTYNFGISTKEPDAHTILDQALDLGINYVDTADVYGAHDDIGPGLTEEIIGRWFAKGGGRREKTVIATKLYWSMGSWPNQSKLSALNIRQACEASLRRLKTDHIDIYQMHPVDRDTPWDEIWQAMEQLVQAGKIIYVGSSNFAGWHIAQANDTARQRNFMGLVSEQSIYNLLVRTVELEVLPAGLAYGIGIVPWSPLAGGLLGGTLLKSSQGRRASDGMQKGREKNRDKLEAYEALCSEMGEHPANVALAWLLANPAVTAPITGPRTAEQLNDSLRALEIEMSPEIMKKLDEIFPGPGGTAPEAYAM